MTPNIVAQDIAVFVALLLAGVLYRMTLSRKLNDKMDRARVRRIANKFFATYTLFAVSILSLGILFQTGILQGAWAYGLIGAVCVAALICLQVFKQRTQ